eukprot:TRINITY_DN48099_c0_g1_i1.p1 TRINITY_DN48099_c0_g1~~TRINITY_DN48099_c0_g1_i1.p1  ORF type:complete len:363 (-),score=94.24 TRINITY_DN48099_c0_g1_i1:120-1127(-)
MAALWVSFVFVFIVVTLAVSCSVGLWYALKQQDSLEELGVSLTYSKGKLPEAKIEAYLDIKDKLREQHAKDAENDSWMCVLPPQAKDMLKYRLMQRAIGVVSVLKEVDGDARGYWKLFSKGIVTSKFWNSVQEVEKNLSRELDEVKMEAFHIEPNQDPQGIISEAMQIVIRYGPDAADDIPGPEDAPGPAQLAKAAQAVAKAMPPGMMPPGAGMMPPMMPPGGPGGPGGPPMMPPGPPPSQQPQTGGETEAYEWKQDTDEVEISVKVPTTAAKAEVKVVIQSKSLKVMHSGNVLIEGQLSAPIDPDGSTWTLSKGRVVVSMEKANPKPWPAVFQS